MATRFSGGSKNTNNINTTRIDNNNINNINLIANAYIESRKELNTAKDCSTKEGRARSMRSALTFTALELLNNTIGGVRDAVANGSICGRVLYIFRAL